MPNGAEDADAVDATVAWGIGGNPFPGSSGRPDRARSQPLFTKNFPAKTGARDSRGMNLFHRKTFRQLRRKVFGGPVLIRRLAFVATGSGTETGQGDSQKTQGARLGNQTEREVDVVEAVVGRVGLPLAQQAGTTNVVTLKVTVVRSRRSLLSERSRCC